MPQNSNYLLIEKEMHPSDAYKYIFEQYGVEDHAVAMCCDIGMFHISQWIDAAVVSVSATVSDIAATEPTNATYTTEDIVYQYRMDQLNKMPSATVNSDSATETTVTTWESFAQAEARRIHKNKVGLFHFPPIMPSATENKESAAESEKPAAPDMQYGFDLDKGFTAIIKRQDELKRNGSNPYAVKVSHLPPETRKVIEEWARSFNKRNAADNSESATEIEKPAT